MTQPTFLGHPIVCNNYMTCTDHPWCSSWRGYARSRRESRPELRFGKTADDLKADAKKVREMRLTSAN